MIVRKRDWERLTQQVNRIDIEQRVEKSMSRSHSTTFDVYRPYLKLFSEHMELHRKQQHAINMSTQAMRPEDV